MNGSPIFIGVLLSLFISTAVSADPHHGAREKGTRLLGIDVQSAADGNYDRALQVAQKAGAQVLSLSFGWDDIEVAPQIYSNDFLAIANSYFPEHGIKVALKVSPIDTNNSRVPEDLSEKALDDPLVIQRFNSMLDYVLGQLSAVDIVTLAIGNEVDASLGSNEVAWGQFIEFFKQTSAHAHGIRALITGVTITREGHLGLPGKFAKRLSRFTDAIFVTYYPVNADFAVQDLSVVEQDFFKLCKRYPGRKIYLLEAGYPSSVRTGSSLQRQALFVRHIFRAWDRHPRQIPLVLFSWLTDWSKSKVEEAGSYYRDSDPVFLAFLKSLGLRTYPGAGRNKPAFAALKEEATARGWRSAVTP